MQEVEFCLVLTPKPAQKILLVFLFFVPEAPEFCHVYAISSTIEIHSTVWNGGGKLGIAESI